MLISGHSYRHSEIYIFTCVFVLLLLLLLLLLEGRVEVARDTAYKAMHFLQLNGSVLRLPCFPLSSLLPRLTLFISLSLFFFHLNQLMYWKIVDVCYETHKKHTNTFCGQNVGSLMLNLVVIKVTTYL